MNLWARVFTTLYRRVWIMAKDLTTHIASTESTPFELRLLDASSLAAYEAYRPGQGAKAWKRIEAGHQAILVCEGARIVGSVWTATKRAYIPYLDRDVLLSDHDVYTYDAFTHPEYRRRGVATLRNDLLVTQCQTTGYKRAAAVVAFENYVGLRSAAAAGYERLGSFACLRLGITQIDLPGATNSINIPRLVSPINRRAPG